MKKTKQKDSHDVTEQEIERTIVAKATGTPNVRPIRETEWGSPMAQTTEIKVPYEVGV